MRPFSCCVTSAGTSTSKPDIQDTRTYIIYIYRDSKRVTDNNGSTTVNKIQPLLYFILVDLTSCKSSSNI